MPSLPVLQKAVRNHVLSLLRQLLGSVTLADDEAVLPRPLFWAVDNPVEQTINNTELPGFRIVSVHDGQD